MVVASQHTSPAPLDFLKCTSPSLARPSAVAAEMGALEDLRIDEADVDRALAAFEPVWEGLSSSERGRLLDLLVERIDYDGAAGKIAIRFRPTGIRTLAQQREIQ